MNAIGGFSARLYGFRRGHLSKMISRQKQDNADARFEWARPIIDVAT
jgi:hypothetical protein